MASRTSLRVDWGELPTRFREWRALSPWRKLLWWISKLSQIFIFYGIFAIVVLGYNLPDPTAAVIDGEKAIWSLLPHIVAEYELMLLLVITPPLVAFLVIVPHRRVDEHGREVP